MTTRHKQHFAIASADGPLCGRQLINERATRAQTQAGIELFHGHSGDFIALGKAKACAFCLEALGAISLRQEPTSEQLALAREALGEAEFDGGEDE